MFSLVHCLTQFGGQILAINLPHALTLLPGTRSCTCGTPLSNGRIPEFVQAPPFFPWGEEAPATASLSCACNEARPMREWMVRKRDAHSHRKGMHDACRQQHCIHTPHIGPHAVGAISQVAVNRYPSIDIRFTTVQAAGQQHHIYAPHIGSYAMDVQLH